VYQLTKAWGGRGMFRDSKEENAEDFCLGFVQEFGLCTILLFYGLFSNPSSIAK
jgi:hypothetical protein